LLAFNIEKKSKKMCCLELFPFILKEIWIVKGPQHVFFNVGLVKNIFPIFSFYGVAIVKKCDKKFCYLCSSNVIIYCIMW
jgi:hypothetical protein